MSIWNKIFGGSRSSSASNDAAEAIVSGMKARMSAQGSGTFETGEKNPQQVLCSDSDGPCAGTEVLVIGKTAYLYISQQVVDFRKDCLSIMERDIKLQDMSRSVRATALTVDGGIANPFYLCEACAKARGLNLSVALEDAKTAAKTGFAPLRPTPLSRPREVSDTEPTKSAVSKDQLSHSGTRSEPDVRAELNDTIGKLAAASKLLNEVEGPEDGRRRLPEAGILLGAIPERFASDKIRQLGALCRALGNMGINKDIQVCPDDKVIPSCQHAAKILAKMATDASQVYEEHYGKQNH